MYFDGRPILTPLLTATAANHQGVKQTGASSSSACGHETRTDPLCKPACTWEDLVGNAKTRAYDPKTQCCTPKGVEPKLGDYNLGFCKDAGNLTPRTGYKPSKNGCGPAGSKFPNTWKKASFKPACDAHDICYGTCHSNKAACDEKFAARLVGACDKVYPKAGANRKDCIERAELYADGPRGMFGQAAFNRAQREACQCCP